MCANEFLHEVRMFDNMRLDYHETNSKCVYTTGDTVLCLLVINMSINN